MCKCAAGVEVYLANGIIISTHKKSYLDYFIQDMLNSTPTLVQPFQWPTVLVTKIIIFNIIMCEPSSFAQYSVIYVM